LYVSSRLGVGPQTTYQGSYVAGHDRFVQDAVECAGGKPRAPGAAQNTGKGSQGDAFLHKGLRPDTDR